ncbi:PPC domain-containing protein [Paenibacillus sp. 481]|uniref:PPC domain-containing protein n=1 Tax=Paenibacillus sp. 481 TaxID=2835869 RepID=UPI001E573801|nr:PPC domain-containing protein [Paenibacillus sp. 481]UHA75175.1 PPC domain-containing protein [Paenibacillus sp. 481]
MKKFLLSILGASLIMGATMGTAFAASEREPNDTADRADRLDFGANSGHVGGQDNDDYWFFELTSRTRVEFHLKDLSDDADLYLLDINETGIDKSINTGKRKEKVSGTLAPGKYYVHVTKGTSSANANYTLEGVKLN